MRVDRDVFLVYTFCFSDADKKYPGPEIARGFFHSSVTTMASLSRLLSFFWFLWLFFLVFRAVRHWVKECKERLGWEDGCLNRHFLLRD